MTGKKRLSLSDIAVLVVPTLVFIVYTIFYLNPNTAPRDFHGNPLIESIQDGLVLTAFGLALYNVYNKKWKKYKGFLLGLCVLLVIVLVNETEYLSLLFGFDTTPVINMDLEKILAPAEKLFDPIQPVMSGAALLIVIAGLIAGDRYDRVPVLKGIPRLSRTKYWYLLGVLVAYGLFLIKFFVIPVMNPDISMADFKNFYYVFEHMSYREVFFTADYFLGIILLVFQPDELNA